MRKIVLPLLALVATPLFAQQKMKPEDKKQALAAKVAPAAKAPRSASRKPATAN